MLVISVQQWEFYFFGLLVFSGIAIQIFVSKKVEKTFSYHHIYSAISLVFIISSLLILAFPVLNGDMRTIIQSYGYSFVVLGLGLLFLLILIEPSGFDLGTPVLKGFNYLKLNLTHLIQWFQDRT